MKSDSSWGFGIVLSEAAWSEDWLEEGAWLYDPGAGTSTVPHCITDPDWLLPFTAGVADYKEISNVTYLLMRKE